MTPMTDSAETDDTTINVFAIRAGLRDLRTHMPRAPEHLHAFGELLADYMNDEIYPEGMQLAVSLLMYDLERGRSGYSSVHIPHKLTGLPRVVLAALEMSIPSMLRAAAGEEHAAVAEKLIAGLGGR